MSPIMNVEIAPGETLRSIAQDLANPTWFVGKVLDHMEGADDDIRVSIGLRGPKERPSYRVFRWIWSSDGEHIVDQQTIISVSGLSHKRLDEDEILRERWSKASIPLSDVRDLLHELRAKQVYDGQ